MINNEEFFPQSWQQSDFWAMVPNPSYESELDIYQAEGIHEPTSVFHFLEMSSTQPCQAQPEIQNPQMIQWNEHATQESQEGVEKLKKSRHDNTIDRPIVTALRNAIKSECQGDVVTKKQLSKVPYNLVGIELLFSYIELHPLTSYSLASLMLIMDDVRQQGGRQYNGNTERRKQFDRRFDRVIKALVCGKDYKQRLEILYDGRKHNAQIQKVESKRKLWKAV